MSRKYTHEEYVDAVKAKHPHMEVRSKYDGKRKPILLHCNIHNYDFEIKADSALNSVHGCKLCAIDYVSGCKRKSQEEFLEEVKDVLNPNVIIIGEYVNTSTKIKCQCKDCGNIWDVVPYSLLKGYGCKKCAMRYVQNYRIKSHEQFLREFNERNPQHKTIEILSEYIKDEEPVLCRCKVCNHTWSTRAHNLISKQSASGCPICNTSKGELKIMSYLEENNIPFEWQKSYDDLIGTGGGSLSYDFYIPTNNTLIEYQGEFHDGTAPYQTKAQLEYQKEHDRRKREYAKNNNITLLEIWYKDFDNIEQILEENFAA